MAAAWFNKICDPGKASRGHQAWRASTFLVSKNWIGLCKTPKENPLRLSARFVTKFANAF